MTNCDMGGCGRPPTWRVCAEELVQEYANYRSLRAGTPACNEHLAEACYFVRQFGEGGNLTVKPFVEE